MMKALIAGRSDWLSSLIQRLLASGEYCPCALPKPVVYSADAAIAARKKFLIACDIRALVLE